MDQTPPFRVLIKPRESDNYVEVAQHTPPPDGNKNYLSYELENWVIVNKKYVVVTQILLYRRREFFHLPDPPMEEFSPSIEENLGYNHIFFIHNNPVFKFIGQIIFIPVRRRGMLGNLNI